MSNMLTLDEGRLLVQYARKCAFHHLSGADKSQIPSLKSLEIFNESRGVFVSVHSYPTRELRGCIGFVQNPPSIVDAVASASVHACVGDSRFHPVSLVELDNLIFEVSVLSNPSLLTCPANQRAKHIKIGRDGLLIQYGHSSGLLLAQVATEWNFNSTQFLDALCEKSGLPSKMHSSQSAKIFTFNQQVFEELSPNGKIISKKLLI